MIVAAVVGCCMWAAALNVSKELLGDGHCKCAYPNVAPSKSEPFAQRCSCSLFPPLAIDVVATQKQHLFHNRLSSNLEPKPFSGSRVNIGVTRGQQGARMF
jgi:hypothetical protein